MADDIRFARFMASMTTGKSVQDFMMIQAGDGSPESAESMAAKLAGLSGGT